MTILGDDGQLWDQQGIVYTTGRGVLVNPGIVAHQKGAWSSVAFTADRDYNGFLFQVFMQPASGFGVGWAFDLAWSNVDTFSPETNVYTFVRNLIVQSPSQLSAGLTFHIPMAIPTGATIYVRCQQNTTTANNTLDVAITGLADGVDGSPAYGICTSYGTLTTGTQQRGTAVTAGTAPTLGGWVDLTSIAPLSHPVRALILSMFTIGAIASTARIYWDIGLGVPADPPTVLIPNIAQAVSSTHDQYIPQIIGPIPVQIPAGKSISVRGTHSISPPALRVALYTFS